MYGQILGYITATINFFLYLPQVIHVYKLKDTTSINSHFILLQILSCITTLMYGAIIRQIPVIISSVSILISSLYLGYVKWFLHSSQENNEPVKYTYESIDSSSV
jgi:uncharacterized protein with PQ loop repeat